MEAKMEITVTRLGEGYDVGVMAKDWNVAELLSAVAALIQMGVQKEKKFFKAVKNILRDYEGGNMLPQYTIEIPGFTVEGEDENAE